MQSNRVLSDRVLHMSGINNKVLLICGAIAGPFFTLLWYVQGLTRADYDPMRHPISSLAMGEFGWIQVASFVITGSLILAFWVELRSMLWQPSGSVWGPRLIGLLGIGLIGAGLFVTDPLNGYPPGTPLIPAVRTTHGILHDIFGVPFFLGLPIACFVFGRLFTRWGERSWAVYSALSGFTMFAVFFVARLGGRIGSEELIALFGLLQRITVTIGFAWLSLLAVYMFNAPAETATAGRK